MANETGQLTREITGHLTEALPQRFFAAAPPPDVRRGLPQRSFAAASPPDVRRGSASPWRLKMKSGLRPSFGLCPKFIGQRPYPGQSPNCFQSGAGEASLAAHQAAEPRQRTGAKPLTDEITGESAGEVEVSVVIPTYNRSSLLRDAVASVLAQQTQTPFEIVIVDNNSQDDTPSVARALVQEHPQQVSYVLETQQGNAHARNRGVQTARAGIIAFIDDDVTVERDWLATLKQALDTRQDLSFVGGRVLPQWDGPAPSWLTPEHWSPLALLDYGPDELIISGERPRGLLTANIAFRRAVFDQVGQFSPHLQRVKNMIGSMEDTEFLLRVCRSGRRGLYLPQMIAKAPVEVERLSKAYHRRWHTGHGHFYAVMRDPQWERSKFQLLGVPSHLYKQTAVEGLKWCFKSLTGQTSDAFTSECRLRFFRGFFRQRRRQVTQT